MTSNDFIVYELKPVVLENNLEIQENKLNCLCRLCLTKLESDDFSQNLFSESGKSTIAAMIQYCTSLDVTDQENELPKVICENCLFKLKIAFNFKIQALSSDEILRSQEVIEEDTENYSQKDTLEEPEIEDFVVNDIVAEEYIIGEDIICETVPDSEIPLETSIKMEENSYLPDLTTNRAMFECEFCYKKIFSEATYKSHMKHHVKLNDFQVEKCLECQKTFYLKEKFYQHVCVRSTSLKCYICSIRLTSIRSVNEHIQTQHANDRDCHSCGAQLKTPQKLNRHLKSHVVSESLICCFCSRKFSDREAFLKHENLHKFLSKSLVFICDFCGKNFRFKTNMKKHLEALHLKKKFDCDLCSSVFTSLDNLKTHKIKAHGHATNVICGNPGCKKKFQYKSQLKIHLMNTVNCRNSPLNAELSKTIKLFKCSSPGCFSEFGNKTNLRRHEAIHKNEKKFSCDTCGLKFIQKEGLTAHKNIHMRELIYKCPTCSVRFSSRSGLNKHVRKSHADAEKIPFKTPFEVLNLY